MKAFFEKVGNLIAKKYLIISLICLALIVPAIIGASKVENEIGVKTFASHSSKEYKDYTRFTDNFSENISLLILRADTVDQLIQRDNIVALADFEQRMSGQPNVSSVVGPAFVINMIAEQRGMPGIPNQQILSMIFNDPSFAEFFLNDPNGQYKYMLGAQVVAAVGTKDADLYKLVDAMDKAVAETKFKDATAIAAGNPNLLNETNDEMTEALKVMIVVALAIMLVILLLIFKVRNFFAWRWFPLGAAFIGIIYTFGLMGLFGIPLGIATLAAFPILIGLGVGFAIQFHDRYDKAVGRGETPAKAVTEAITHIGPTTGIAAVVLCLGFAATLTHFMPAIKDFGLSLIIGTLALYLLSVFLLLPILYWNDYRKESKKTPAAAGPQAEGEGFVERGLRKLTPFVVKNPIVIILLAIILCITGFILDSRIDAEPDVVRYFSKDLQSIKNINLLSEITGGRQNASILVEADDVTKPEVLNWMQQLQQTITAEEIKETGAVGTIDSITDDILQATGGTIPADSAQTKQILAGMPPALTLNKVTPDLNAANIALTFPGLSADDLTGLKGRLEEYTANPPDGVTAAVTGTAILQSKMSSGLTGGREKMTYFGMAFVFVGLLLLFRFRIKRAIVAALPTVFIIGWAAIIVYLMGTDYNPLGATRAAMGMGIGVIFTILLMSRYYEERERGQNPAEAITSAMVGVGRPIITCGLTVIGGFAALQMATAFPIITDFGVVTLVTIFFGLVSTLIVLPPMIVLTDSLFGKRSTQVPKG